MSTTFVGTTPSPRSARGSLVREVGLDLDEAHHLVARPRTRCGLSPTLLRAAVHDYPSRPGGGLDPTLKKCWASLLAIR